MSEPQTVKREVSWISRAWSVFCMIWLLFIPINMGWGWLSIRSDLIYTREIYSVEEGFSIRIPVQWQLNASPNVSSTNRMAIALPSSLLSFTILDKEVGIYSARRRFYQTLLANRQHMFAEIFISREALPDGVNPSVQELNETLLAALQEMEIIEEIRNPFMIMGNLGTRSITWQNLSEVQSDVVMLNDDYAWGKTSMTFREVSYVFWQTAVSEHNHFTVLFRTDNLPLMEPLFENIMRSFSSVRR